MGGRAHARTRQGRRHSTIGTLSPSVGAISSWSIGRVRHCTRWKQDSSEVRSPVKTITPFGCQTYHSSDMALEQDGTTFRQLPRRICERRNTVAAVHIAMRWSSYSASGRCGGLKHPPKSSSGLHAVLRRLLCFLSMG